MGNASVRSASVRSAKALLLSLVIVTGTIGASAIPAQAAGAGRSKGERLRARALRNEHMGAFERFAPGSRSHHLQAALSAAGVEAQRDTAALADVWLETWTYPAGDLDADGTTDILVDRWTYNFDTDEESVSSEALNGESGMSLWKIVPEGFGYVIPAGPIDTTAGDDVYVLGAADSQYIAEEVHSYKVFVEARTGTSAASLWREEYDHSGAWVEAFVAYAEVESEYPVVTGIHDLNGDGLNDILFSRQAYEYVCLPTDCLDRGRTKIDAISGADGSALTTYKTGETYMIGFSVDDLTADGAADVVVLSGTATGLSLELHSGRGGLLWTKVLPDAWDVYGRTLDTTGDGVAELVLETYIETAEDYGITLAVMDGTGTEVWSQSFWGEWYTDAGGDANGDGAQDLVAFDWSSFWDEEAEPAAVAMLDGTNGNEIWSHEFVRPAYPSGDLNGDGANDLAVDNWGYDEDTDTTVTDYLFFSGTDAALLWSRTGLSTSWIGGVYDDLDGDGSDDLLLMRESPNFQYRPLRGVDGTAFWGAAVGGPGYLTSLGTSDATEGTQIVEAWVDEEEATDVIRARRGVDGSMRWSGGSAAS